MPNANGNGVPFATHLLMKIKCTATQFSVLFSAKDTSNLHFTVFFYRNAFKLISYLTSQSVCLFGEMQIIVELKPAAKCFPPE